MNILLEKNLISEMECGSNFAYTLSSNSMFLSTEYKVLQNQAASGFVKCMKMLYNGKVQLYYISKGLKPLSTILPALDADSFMVIVTNLLSNIIDVKHNGFLSCRNIDLSFERIYVDVATRKINLIYLPLSEHVYEDNAAFENDLRTELIKLISSLPGISDSKTNRLSEALSDGTMTLEDIYSQLKGGKTVLQTSGISRTSVGEASGLLRIVAMNAPTRMEIVVNKDEFIIGKKAEMCDAVIAYNPMISRKHCKISKRGDRYTLTDLKSANGTCINGAKLQPEQAYFINNGDVIRLANSDFQVSIG